jgi:acyl-CoA thioester hydrolase
VHFDDLDAMGVVHNARYAVFVERAYDAYWSRLGLGFTGPASSPDAFAAVGEFSISYHVPITAIGEIGIHMWIERMGTSSSTVRFRILSADGATVHAEGYRVNIKVDPITMRPTPWSDRARDLATSLAAPVSADRDAA